MNHPFWVGRLRPTVGLVIGIAAPMRPPGPLTFLGFEDRTVWEWGTSVAHGRLTGPVRVETSYSPQSRVSPHLRL